MQCPSCAAPLATHARDCSGCGWPHARPQVTPPGGLSCTDLEEERLLWAFQVPRRTSTARTPPVVGLGPIEEG